MERGSSGNRERRPSLPSRGQPLICGKFGAGVFDEIIAFARVFDAVFAWPSMATWPTTQEHMWIPRSLVLKHPDSRRLRGVPPLVLLCVRAIQNVLLAWRLLSGMTRFMLE